MPMTAKTRGFTLIEIVVSIVAASVLFTLVIASFNPEIRRGTDPLVSIRAAELGKSYLEEILGRRFDENSPVGNMVRCDTVIACSHTMGSDGETTRANFDDVDDYNGFAENPPQTVNGVAREGYAGFAVAVAVEYAGAELDLDPRAAKRVDVTVTAPADRGGASFVFSAYKANF